MKFRLIPVIFTAALTSVVTFYGLSRFQQNTPYFTAVSENHNATPVKFVSNDGVASAGNVNFEMAAESSVKAVVHIKTTTLAHTVPGNNMNDIFSQLFGQRQYYIPSQVGSGSGVVISADGYIITNNHVVADANEVTVTFNDRNTMQAKIVGTDAATDIAVLKVDGKNLPFMEFGNSDDVKIGQWVLAVGYPLSLDATVTAGIISAKSRSLGLNQTKSAAAIESYIQTDAAVNPGNSGGALVNTSGNLIGINSAIASPTGSYAGYSYAIPSNIVRKAVNDLIKYGEVQRGYLGIQYLDSHSATPEQLASLGIDHPQTNGMYVESVIPNSGAAKAGISKGDFITKINGIAVNTQSELQEQIVRYKPGDHVNISYSRNGSENSVSVELTNVYMNTDIVKEGSITKLLGASFRPLSESEKKKYNLGAGIVVTDVGKGIIAQQTQMLKGFVITGVNNSVIKTINDLQAAVAGNRNLQISGFYPGYQGMYYYGINNADTYNNEQ